MEKIIYVNNRPDYYRNKWYIDYVIETDYAKCEAKEENYHYIEDALKRIDFLKSHEKTMRV